MVKGRALRGPAHIKNTGDTEMELTESANSRYNKSDLVEAPGTHGEPGVEGTPEKLISMSAEGARPYPAETLRQKDGAGVVSLILFA